MLVPVESELFASDEQEESELRVTSLVQAPFSATGNSKARIEDFHLCVDGRIR